MQQLSELKYNKLFLASFMLWDSIVCSGYWVNYCSLFAAFYSCILIMMIVADYEIAYCYWLY